jgi:hypothetical protein
MVGCALRAAKAAKTWNDKQERTDAESCDLSAAVERNPTNDSGTKRVVNPDHGMPATVDRALLITASSDVNGYKSLPMPYNEETSASDLTANIGMDECQTRAAKAKLLAKGTQHWCSCDVA